MTVDCLQDKRLAVSSFKSGLTPVDSLDNGRLRVPTRLDHAERGCLTGGSSLIVRFEYY
jgi:hypothetical protein